MNKKLQKQIKAYAGVAAIIAGAGKVNGQVSVNNNPNLSCSVTIPNDTCSLNLDIDNDGHKDFDLNLRVWSTPSSVTSTGICQQYEFFAADTINNNSFLGEAHPCYSGTSIIKIMNCGEMIDDSALWKNPNGERIGWVAVGCGYNSSSCFPLWIMFGDAVLGIKFKINNAYHFGWIKVHLAYTQMDVLQTGYQLQPGIPVVSCDTINLATAISENNFQFNFFQQNNSIHISTLQKLNHANIFVYDLLGKEILQQPFEGNETTIKIDKKGIYFVEVKPVPNSSASEKGVFRKKVFIY